MATVVNTTPANASTDNGMGFVLGIILLIAFVGILLFFGLPYVRGGYGSNTGTSVNVPDHMNVNVQHSGTK